jgi:hypothetical protein
VRNGEILVWTKNKHLNNGMKKFDKVMLSNAYLINGASKCITSFTIMNVSLFVFIYNIDDLLILN